MPISEAARSDLYAALARTIGSDATETLMSSIPLHDLDEVATKRDLQVLRAELSAEMATRIGDTHERITDLHERISDLQKTVSNWMLVLLVTIVGAMVGTQFLP
jgi:hypothetical protein